MKNKFLSSLLAVSLLHFAGCTTLSSAERCALIGQVHAGTQIGTRTHVSSYGSSVYSYNTPSYNPICKIPETSEEDNIVAEWLPIAQEKQRKRRMGAIITSGITIVVTLLAAIVLASN